jgi:tripartite-type tricarboxylate transporter receptor subunit TctC
MTSISAVISSKARFFRRLCARPQVVRAAVSAALLAAVALLTPSAPSAAENYPDRPIKFVLPYGPGGVADVTARIVADKLGNRLGQQFVIENMPGAGGITAAHAVISAQPDGYTLGLITNGTAISAAQFRSLPFDPAKDFAMISRLGTFDLLFAVNAAGPYRTLMDFVNAAKAQPGKLNIATVSAGSTQNLAAELFSAVAGINVQIVPYRTSPDILVALLRNDVQMLLEFPAAIKGQVEAGKVRVLATSGPNRWPVMADVPTAQEAGVKGYEVTSWNGIFAPKDTPAPILATLHDAIVDILAEPDVKEKLRDLGIEPAPSTPAALLALLNADVKKWDDVIVTSGIEKQ